MNENKTTISIPDIAETRNFLALSSMVVPDFTMDELANFGPCVQEFLEPVYSSFVQEVVLDHVKEAQYRGVKKSMISMEAIIMEVLSRIKHKLKDDLPFRELFWKAFLADCVYYSETLEELRNLLRDLISAMENCSGVMKV